MNPEIVMENFLLAEIQTQGLYEDIYRFITSFHIRSGEFEGNEFIIKKMDQINFILFPEYDYPDGTRGIHYARAVYKKDLLREIQACAKRRGLRVIDS